VPPIQDKAPYLAAIQPDFTDWRSSSCWTYWERLWYPTLPGKAILTQTNIICKTIMRVD